MNFCICANFVSDEIAVERGLPSRNPAVSKRVFGIAAGLSAISETFVLAPGSCPTMATRPRNIHPERRERCSGFWVVYAPALAVNYANLLYSPVVMAMRIAFLLRPPSTVILVNYMPETFFAAFVAKFYLGSRVMVDIEDICELSLAENGAKSRLRQIFGFFLMKAALGTADGAIFPSTKFPAKLKYRGNFIVLPSANIVEASRAYIGRENEKIVVLYNGLINGENGVGLFCELLRICAQDPRIEEKIDFVVCGYGDGIRKIQCVKELCKSANLTITGYLNNIDYLSLIARSDICLALQDPDGIHSSRKVPSKVFEAMSHGVAAIVSGTGDFSDFPDGTCIALSVYSAVCLKDVLLRLSSQQCRATGESGRLYALRNLSVESSRLKIQDLVSSFEARDTVVI